MHWASDALKAEGEIWLGEKLQSEHVYLLIQLFFKINQF
jgi:hypothetical protein